MTEYLPKADYIITSNIWKVELTITPEDMEYGSQDIGDLSHLVYSNNSGKKIDINNLFTFNVIYHQCNADTDNELKILQSTILTDFNHFIYYNNIERGKYIDLKEKVTKNLLPVYNIPHLFSNHGPNEQFTWLPNELINDTAYLVYNIKKEQYMVVTNSKQTYIMSDIVTGEIIEFKDVLYVYPSNRYRSFEDFFLPF